MIIICAYQNITRIHSNSISTKNFLCSLHHEECFSALNFLGLHKCTAYVVLKAETALKILYQIQCSHFVGKKTQSQETINILQEYLYNMHYTSHSIVAVCLHVFSLVLQAKCLESKNCIFYIFNLAFLIDMGITKRISEW